MNHEQKKSGVRFNIFDAIIILIVLVCIAAIGVHIYFTTTHAKENVETAVVTFEISGVSDVTAVGFCKQDAPLYLQKSGDLIGSLGECTYGPMQVYTENGAGELITVPHPVKKDVKGAAVMTGVWTENGFMIGGQIPATVGKPVDIYTKDVMCTIVITGVSK